MKILDLKDLKNLKKNSVVTLGFFDGIHKAHEVILSSLVNISKENNYNSVVITFSDDILNLFKMSNNITSLNDKLEVFKNMDIDYVIVLKQSDNFMSLTAKEFINQYLKPINCKTIVCGSDFSFAKNKEGNINFIKENTDYNVILIDDIYDENNNKISSTYIRKLLKEGNVSLANKYLYKNFKIDSKVISGKEIGRTIGFKTANLLINNQCYLLAHGVYFGTAIIDNKEYKAMINVGINPTVSDNNSLKVEVHILDFNDDIYQKNIKVIFDKFHREEIKFNSLDELKKQLISDFEKLNDL